ncbi:hypothetical protein AU184_04860 [Mycolicibacterium novocastrense]|uniref:hypothetical protein n=1 Tax=Mycolicibacterium novocastrense TaxID=59813 RepID=UPI000746B31F|nr:hypothetical protein [Mycolicibacterium novocastrense]KUH73165.1 hypothetical protein AU072_00785 [Mycolicibacterium novocastrense]KUH74248.1 hypothetical protein AU183_12780 [Mycolicibacterium novocastrense]KUH75293.1 hypothetical protein AU184_04860 [Mycolicibacterium novocastrense]
MEIPFIGSDAVAAGHLTRAHLRSHYRPLYRGVYVPRGHQASLRERIVGVSLGSPSAVIAGVAASAMHGAKWVGDDVPIEMIAAVRRQRGLIVRDETLDEDEVTAVAGIRVTTPARTAFDLGRHHPRDRAVARLDALMNARPFAFEDVALLAKRHRGVRGLRQLRAALPLVDGGAESPRETWLRLLFIDSGLPRPTTQIVVKDEWGRYVRRIDMCWEDFKVGAEYDGEQHLTSRRQYVLDVRVNRVLQRLGWHVIHVIKEDCGADIVEQARDALLSRAWRP